MSELCDLVEELIDDWGDPRLERLRDLIMETTYAVAEQLEADGIDLREEPQT